jgi:putative methyltransferase (TIGR04325 family)
MGPIGKLHKLVDALSMAPGVRHYRVRSFNRWFEHNPRGHNLFRGVFASFEAAAASVPQGVALGYDNEQAATMYAKRLVADEHDYPAMFWLEKSFTDGLAHVVDLGGSIGIKYYAFEPHLSLPRGLSWTVCDVPSAARQGRAFAAERRSGPALLFTDQFADINGCDVLYASGVVQYLPQTLADILSGLPNKPQRLVINTAAIHPSKSFFTLNSIGTAFCPYRVQSLEAFVCGITARGEGGRESCFGRGTSRSCAQTPALLLPHAAWRFCPTTPAPRPIRASSPY